jgi:hypothetical protein
MSPDATAHPATYLVLGDAAALFFLACVTTSFASKNFPNVLSYCKQEAGVLVMLPLSNGSSKSSLKT